jgi:predicted GNAT family N-acyltransferase
MGFVLRMKKEAILVEDPILLEKIFALRYDVFVLEQKVPEELERDEEDNTAIHAVILDGEDVVATGRLVIHGNIGKIGRMAVKKGLRHQGLGGKILQKLLETGAEKGISHFYLHAQLYVRDFYAKHGFVPVGEVFEEAGILHQKMELKKKGAPEEGVE